MPSNTRLPRLVIACALVVAGPALAQDSARRSLRVPDIQPERTPANTAVPEYPEDARRDRLEGETRVCFRVDEKGEVVRPRIRSSTHKVFERPALKAIRASTFEPLRGGERESLSETCRTYRFKLDQLDPLYAPAESTALQAAESDSAASSSSAASSTSADGLPPAEPAPLTLARPEANASAEQFTLIAEATPLPPAEPLCETRNRPGTRITYRYCYTPEQAAAGREAGERTYQDMSREGAWIDQTIQEAQMGNSYPRGAGLGPR